MNRDDRHCEICRAPWAAMPCARCAMPPPTFPNRPRVDGVRRSVEPIRLEGKYLLLEELGRGGMGTVFRAIDETLDRIVAVKFLLPEIQAMEDAVELFRREARAMASINHRNVVRVYDFGRYGAADFLVCEYVDGPTVEELIDVSYGRGVHIAISEGVEILVQAASGLAAVHEAGVVHRDIKPGNVMYEADTGRVVIMDFGIGRKVEFDRALSPVGKQGTPAYMAPEIIVNREIDPPCERLADIYAFGVTAFELMTQRLPFEGESFLETLEKHVDEAPPRPSSLRPAIPRALEDTILKCLEKDPARRFATAEEIRDSLAAIERSLRQQQVRDGTHRPSKRPG